MDLKLSKTLRNAAGDVSSRKKLKGKNNEKGDTDS